MDGLGGVLGCLGGVWRPLGGVLGGLGGVLGCLGGVWRPLGGGLGGLGGVLEAVLGVLEASWRPRCTKIAPRWPSDRKKCEKH